MPKKGDFFFLKKNSQSQMEQENCERDHEIRELTPRRDQPVMSEDLREELQGNSERSQPTATKDDVKPAVTFGQWKETSLIVITLNLEFSSTCPKKNDSQPH